MADTTIVPAPSALNVPFIGKDFSVSYHLAIAFEITGAKVRPIYWPEPPRGAQEVQEQPGRYSVGDLHASTPGALAQAMRERVQ